MSVKIKTNWQLKKDEAGLKVLEKIKDKLDYRKSVVKNATEEDLDRIIGSILAYRGMTIHVLQKELPSKDKDLVAEVVEVLRGDILKSVSSTEFEVVFQSAPLTIKTLTPEEYQFRYAVTLSNGSVVYDDHFRDFELTQIKAINARQLQTVKVVEPETQARFALFDKCPTRNFFEVEATKVDIETLSVEDLEELLPQHRDSSDKWSGFIEWFAEKNYRHAAVIVPYKEGIFLTGSIDVTAQQLEIDFTRFTGKRFKFLLECFDQYGRKFVRNGSRY